MVAKFYSNTIETPYGKYDIVSLRLYGGTFVMVAGDNVAKLSPDVQIDENTIRVEEHIIADSFYMGNEHTYIEQLEIGLGLREDE